MPAVHRWQYIGSDLGPEGPSLPTINCAQLQVSIAGAETMAAARGQTGPVGAASPSAPSQGEEPSPSLEQVLCLLEQNAATVFKLNGELTMALGASPLFLLPNPPSK
jgi:hypothetical protein